MGKLDEAVWVGWRERAEADKKLAGKTDADLAAEVTELLGYDVSRALVNAWFRGRREPSIREFVALCTALGSDAGHVLLNVRMTYRQVPASSASVAIRDPGGNPEYLAKSTKQLKRTKKRKPTTTKRKVRQM